MEKIIFDAGIKEYQIGNGVLRFNPADYNLFARFFDANQKLQDVEAEMVEKGQHVTDGESVVRLMREADDKAKTILNEVFGGHNDFHEILGGVNLMSVADNGERVITNLIHALTPIITQGAEACVQSTVAEAKANREARRAAT